MQYAVLLYGDERRWLDADAETRSKVYARHDEFSRVVSERGHKIVGGAELRGSDTAKTVRGTADEFTTTDGPFAETAEQLGGFYLIETDDLDGLAAAVAMLSFGESCEIRPCVPPEKQP